MPHRVGKRAIEVGEVEERRRRGELLPLKQHRRPRQQQQQRRHRAPAARARDLMAPRAARGVRHLIVVLQKRDERRRRHPPRRRAARLALPVVVLSLEQIPVLGRRDQFLRLAARVAVVRLGVAGERDHRAVVEIVVPDGVEAAAAVGDRPHEPRVLRFALRDHDDRAITRRAPRARADLRDDGRRRAIEDLLRRVEAEAIEVKLRDPVLRVREKEFPHRTRVGAVEVDRVAPLVLVAIGEVGGRERAQVIAHRPEMVVDDVEDHGDAARVRRVDEAPEVVGRAVKTRRREQIDAVVAPPEAPLELRDRHHLDERDADARELPQLLRRRGKRARARERADVHLVRDLSRQHRAGPRLIGPAERVRIDDLGRSVRTLGLKARRRIRIQPIVVVELEPIAIADARVGGAAEIAAGLRPEWTGTAAAIHDRDAVRARGPDAKVRPLAVGWFSADWQTSMIGGRDLPRGHGRRRAIGHRCRCGSGARTVPPKLNR